MSVRVVTGSDTERLVTLLERAGDALMRSREEKLAVECYAAALRLRYVTAGYPEAEQHNFEPGVTQDLERYGHVAEWRKP